MERSWEEGDEDNKREEDDVVDDDEEDKDHRAMMMIDKRTRVSLKWKKEELREGSRASELWLVPRTESHPPLCLLLVQ
jgi:hypothetical protein